MENGNWFLNRLKGEFAENIAVIHFSALGYKVERTGIEHTAPNYANIQHMVKFRKYEVSSYMEKVLKFHSNHPDFIASRVTKKSDGTPIINGLFIEVKYRRNVDLSLLREEVKKQYEHYITSGYPVFIYLVCKNVTKENDICFKSSIRPAKFRILFCYLGHDDALWWEAGSPKFDENKMYEITKEKGKITFNNVYKELIIKHLDELSV